MKAEKERRPKPTPLAVSKILEQVASQWKQEPATYRD
jgi:hypothetical protein